MRDVRLRRRDSVDFASAEVNAMAQHRLRGEQAAFFVHICVIARRHVEVAHFFDLLAVLSQVSLEISAKSLRQFARASH
jgi:hypothetical protein